MNIATWNVNSILARLPLALKWLDAKRPDVVCLQETKCTDDRFPEEAFSEIGYCCQLFGQATYNGVAILSRGECEDVQRGFAGAREDAEARVLAATTAGIRIVNVYTPNGGHVGADRYYLKLEWMRQLRAFLDLRYKASEQVLVCGDFNVAPEDRDVYNPELWRGRIMCSDPERAALSEIRAWGFEDAFRLHNAGDKQYSWWDYRAGAFRRNMGLRIDHIWVSISLAARCTAAWIDREPRGWERPSDHAPVVAEFG